MFVLIVGGDTRSPQVDIMNLTLSCCTVKNRFIPVPSLFSTLFLLLKSFTFSVGGGVKVLFENQLGAADFLLPNNSCILYVSECDVIAGSSFRRKLARHRNVSLSAETIVVLVVVVLVHLR